MLTWLGSGSALLTRCAQLTATLQALSRAAQASPRRLHTRDCRSASGVWAVMSSLRWHPRRCDGAVSGSSNEAVTNLFGRLLLCQVSHVTKYAESLIKGSEGAPECDVKGLTSTWALADGGLVFCEVTAVKNEWLFVSSAYSCLVPCA